MEKDTASREIPAWNGTRILKWFGGGVLSLAALVLLTVCGAFVWLRTDAGTQLVASKTVEAMRAAGIEAEIAVFQGPLPGTLRLSGVTLRDPKGVWLKLDDAVLQMDLLELLRWRVVVQELSVRGLDVLRVPELPSEPAPEEEESASSGLPQLPSWLPEMVLERLLLEQIALAPGLLGLPPDTGAVRLALHGSAASGTPFLTGMKIRLDLAAGIGEVSPENVLQLAASSPDGKQLVLDLSLADRKGGLLARLAGWDDLFPLALSLKGDAPLTDWKGTLAAGAGEVLSLAGNVDVAFSSVNEGRLNLQLSLVPGREAPVEVAALLGTETRFLFGASVRPGELGLPLIAVKAPAWSLRGENLSLRETARDVPADLEGTLALQIERPAKLAPLVALPFARGEARVSLSGNMTSPELRLASVLDELRLAEGIAARRVNTTVQASLQEGRALSLHTELVAEGWPFGKDGTERLTLDAAAERKGETLALHRLQVNSGLLRANAEGNWDPARALSGIQARLAVDVPHLDRLCAVLGVKGVASGSLRLGTHVAPLAAGQKSGAGRPSARMGGTLDLELKDASWTEDLVSLQKLVGKKATLNAVLEGGSPALAGSEGASWLNVREWRLVAAGVSAKGNGRFTDGKSPSFETRADLILNELATLVPDVSGTLRATVSARGTLDAPEARVSLECPEMTLKGQKLTAASLQVVSRANLSGAAPGGNGTLRMQCVSGKETMHLGADLRLENGVASLSSLDGNLFGVVLSGNLSARLPDAVRVTPGLDGVFSVRVQNWDALSPFIGSARASKAEFLAKLTSSKNGSQSLSSEMHVAGFSSGTDMSLAGLELRAEVTDLFGAFRATGRIAAGEGHAGGKDGVAWRDAVCEFDAAPSGGRLVSRMHGDLDFEAAARLEGKTLTIGTFRLKDRKHGLGVEVSRPVIVTGVGEKRLSVRDVVLHLFPKGAISLSAEMSESIRAQLAVKEVPLSLARPFLGELVPDGRLNANLGVSGALASPEATLELSLGDVNYAGSPYPPVSCTVKGKLAPRGAFVASLESAGFGGKGLNASLRLPLEYKGEYPALSTKGALQGQVHFEGPLAPLWRFVPLADIRVTGNANLSASLEGTLDAPKPRADLKLDHVVVMDLKNALEVVDINAAFRFLPDGRATLALAGSDGRGGTLSLDGSVNTAQKGYPLHASGKLISFAPLHRRDVRVVLDGDMTVSGLALAPEITARIAIPSGEIRLDDLSGGGFSTLDVEIMDGPNATPPPTSSTAAQPVGKLDARVVIPDRFFVRGLGLESEWKGDLAIRGVLNDPSVVGRLSCMRGVMSLFGKTFTLARGIVSFGGARPPAPLLDVSVQRRTGGYLTEALLSGPATRPRLRLSSQPPMPQDEVVSQMLFGRLPSELSRTEAIQLGAAVASLSGFGTGSRLVDMTRTRLGVDVLRVGSARGKNEDFSAATGGNPLAGPTEAGSGDDGVSSSVVEMGKYIRDDVYVGVQQGIGNSSTEVFVDIEVTPQINLEARTSGEASEVGVNWNWDY